MNRCETDAMNLHLFCQRNTKQMPTLDAVG